MLILISLCCFWFAVLSGLPQYLIEKVVELEWHPVAKWFISKLACVKCVAFWVGLIYFESLLLAILCSLTAIISSRIYYKLLS